TGPGGAKQDVDTVAITVQALAGHVDAAPVIAAPSTTQMVTANTAFAFNQASGNAVLVGDLDAGFNSVRVTLTVTHGTLNVTPLGGSPPSVPSVSGNGTSSVELVGRVDHINFILRSLIYTPASGFTGGDVLTINIDDMGN